MNNSRKVTLIISNHPAEEIRQRTNLSMQGEGEARQKFYLALPLACISCLLAECCRTVEDQRNPSATWRSKAKDADGDLQMGSCMFSIGSERWDSSCSSSAVSARSLPGQFGTSLLQLGWQWGVCSPALLVSHVHNRTAWGYPHVRVP